MWNIFITCVNHTWYRTYVLRMCFQRNDFHVYYIRDICTFLNQSTKCTDTCIMNHLKSIENVYMKCHYMYYRLNRHTESLLIKLYEFISVFIHIYISIVNMINRCMVRYLTIQLRLSFVHILKSIFATVRTIRLIPGSLILEWHMLLM